MFFILDDRFIDIPIIEHLTECLCDLDLFDLMLLCDTLHDLFGGRVKSKLAVNRQIVEILRDELILRLIHLGIGGDLMVKRSGKLQL